MEQKKVAIIFNRMIVGGAEKALLNLLNAIDKSKFDITLFTLDSNGAFFDKIPSGIKVKFTKCGDTKKLLMEDIKHFRVINVANGIYCRLMIRICKDEFEKLCYSLRASHQLEGHFDCAIAYKLGFQDTATVLERINAGKKCVWVHGSVGTTAESRRWLNSVLPQMQRIFCVSKSCKEQLDEVCPAYADITQVFYNLLPAREIIEKSEEQLEFELCGTALVTVGRLDGEKGQQMIPKTARLLLDAGYDFYWYLVGDGQLRETVEAEIQKYDVSDRVILLGTKMNPYPYIKNCDLYVQTSFSEGWCLTVQEAKILRKPIVTTPLPVMHEQIISGENGLIAEDVTPEALAESIKLLLDHPELREKFVEQLSREVCDNSGELQKLYDFIES